MSFAKDLVRDAGGGALLERLEHLDRVRAERRPEPSAPRPPPPDEAARPDVDVLLAGGGLSLLVAPLLAARGLRVAVADRARIGQAHREWNASAPELEPLVAHGLLSRDALRACVVARYRHGLCRFRGGAAHEVSGVLDHAVDARALLCTVREACEERGVVLLDGESVVDHAEGRGGVVARLRDRGGSETHLVARAMIDARGASSPYATADLVCPTVGGVVSGLAEGDAPDEMRPDVGDILATIDDPEDGRQDVWEAFPGRAGETTVYLFRYARRGREETLVDLYARFFERLPRYKRGDARLLRPTFGYIPGWSRLTAAPRAPGRRVFLMGDAAARHSPLTLCGFGAMLRSFAPAAASLAAFLDGGAPPTLADDAPAHALTGALAAVLASGTVRDPNALLDAAFTALDAMGDGACARLLRDEIGTRELVAFLRRTAAMRPRVYREVMGALGPFALAKWGFAAARGATAHA